MFFLKHQDVFFCILYNHNSTILIRAKRQQVPPRNSKDKVFKAVF